MTLHAMMQAIGRALAQLGHRLTEDTEGVHLRAMRPAGELRAVAEQGLPL